MCCILYIPKGVETPSKEELQSVYIFNRHGCGFADSDGNHCKTLSFDRFYKALQKRKTTAHCIIHFRLATHGSISAKNCHPFFDKETGLVFAHNGVLPIESTNDMTDSEIFFRQRFLPELKAQGDDYDSKKLWHYTDTQRGNSRFIFMRGDDVRMLGRWFEIDGVYYSNLNWCYYR